MLAARGANLILVARDKTKLAAALEYAKSHAKNPATQRFHFISADVTIESENERLLAEATEWNNGVVPEIVWANAGSSRPMLFLDCTVETMRKQMDLNFWGSAYLAHKTLRAWFYPSKPYPERAPDAKDEAPRHFIMTSSAVAFVQLAGYSPYAPAKNALRSLADSLREEVMLYNGARRSAKKTNQPTAPFDVKINLIIPGTIKSPGLEQENKVKHPVTFELEDMDPEQTELEAATAAVKGLESGSYVVTTNWMGALLRLGAMMNMPRENLVRDVMGGWLMNLVWLVAGPDNDNKVWNWGKKNGMPESLHGTQ